MTHNLDIQQFDDFFAELHGHQPFTWQRELLSRVMNSDKGWPELLSLPTASGKTACIDIAVFALAIQADRQWQERTTPRRVFFVVDRRIVVDEAYERAEMLARRLNAAETKPGESKILRQVAANLKKLSHTDRALAVARLRGGKIPDDGWADIPSQPAIITGTVDQVGSRLLFRSYGCSMLSASIYAGLVAHDSLIILDEAHCSNPFRQTVHAVQEYVKKPEWRQTDALARPLELMIMSATPPAEKLVTFPASESERNRVLADDFLQRRQNAKKVATLELVKGKARQSGDPLADRAVAAAKEFATSGRQRIAVMVNRVRTATQIAETLKSELTDKADVVLFTGRMRPIDRDEQIEKYHATLKSGSVTNPEKPIVAVTTQCLEVGADFDFDTLITECASLDALQQRFGRLDRLGKLADTQLTTAQAMILTRDSDIKDQTDAVYGTALAETWKWLTRHAQDGRINCGISALRRLMLGDPGILQKLNTAPVDAPTLMPAHLDLLCQTSHAPEPDPDIAVFLHGLNRGAPQVRVAFRVDLPRELDLEDDKLKKQWPDHLRLCPPVTSECLSISLWSLRSWMNGDEQDSDLDVETRSGAQTEDLNEANGEESKLVYLWRGSETVATTNPREIRPNDMVVIPIKPGAAIPQALGILPTGARVDRAEEAHLAAGRQTILRVHDGLLGDLAGIPGIATLLDLVKNLREPEIESGDRQAIQDALMAIARSDTDTSVPRWLKIICEEFSKRNDWRASVYPDSSHGSSAMVLYAKSKRQKETIRLLSDDDDELLIASAEDADSARSLDAHAALVSQAARHFASVVPEFQDLLAYVGLHHDDGKLDPRFQCLLNGSLEQPDRPLAKSTCYLAPQVQKSMRETLGLPDHFRHEALSAQLLQLSLSESSPLVDQRQQDLALHLVASHHGYSRPFMPFCDDKEPQPVKGTLVSDNIHLSAEKRSQLPPAHRLDSGYAERFWRLTRRYGWWGLAYLEAIIRLADRYASARPSYTRENT